jgi:hypothetical protein
MYFQSAIATEFDSVAMHPICPYVYTTYYHFYVYSGRWVPSARTFGTTLTEFRCHSHGVDAIDCKCQSLLLDNQHAVADYNYNIQRLLVDEVADYARNRMKLCGVTKEIFEAAALKAAHGCCDGSIRQLNSLLHRSLIIGCEQKSHSQSVNDENQLLFHYT